MRRCTICHKELTDDVPTLFDIQFTNLVTDPLQRATRQSNIERQLGRWAKYANQDGDTLEVSVCIECVLGAIEGRG